MKLTHLLIILILIFTSTNATATEWPAEVAEISYQVDHSDRIVVGNVSDIQIFYNYTLVTIEVDEWLMNPLSSDEIIIRTEVGTNVELVGEPKFTENETVLLMLEDVNISENRFRVPYGELGKHPLSDKIEILRELEKLPDFGPHVFDELKQNPNVIETRGTIPRFETEDERRNWLYTIEKCGRNVDMSPYFYPEGPVIEYGCDYRGFLVVTFLEGSDIDESMIDEIYQMFDQQARQKKIHEIPVVFEYGDIPFEEEGVPETSGFTAITVVMAFLCILNREQR